MYDFKKPRKSFMDHLTHDNYYLNEKINELYKLTEMLQVNNDYLNKFIFSIYDLSGNYKTNIKIIFFDSSDNILSYLYSDNSGKLFPYKNPNDISTNTIDMSNILLENETNIKNTIINTNSHILDTSKCFPYGYGYHGYPRFPFYPGYPYGYPYGYGINHYRSDDDDDRELNFHNYDMSHNPIPNPIPHPFQISKELNLNNDHIPNHQIPNHYIPNHQIPNHQIPNHYTPNHHIPNHHIPNHHIPNHHIPIHHCHYNHIPNHYYVYN